MHGTQTHTWTSARARKPNAMNMILGRFEVFNNNRWILFRKRISVGNVYAFSLFQINSGKSSVTRKLSSILMIDFSWLNSDITLKAARWIIAIRSVELAARSLFRIETYLKCGIEIFNQNNSKPWMPYCQLLQMLFGKLNLFTTIFSPINHFMCQNVMHLRYITLNGLQINIESVWMVFPSHAQCTQTHEHVDTYTYRGVRTLV